eukprot:TRINITY_DN12514_c0_g1_i1.p1 TRINITY_DN12514_c0_g1~~TRINITY_DN12514_c0_g1_i1.p1  ORF type:complete len:100 (-),score=4.34 TRINITY_DN12514_c0_g1_i1:16-315(-)
MLQETECRPEGGGLGEVTRFSIYGGLFHGPLIYNWVNFISRLLPKTTVPHVILKVMVDQVCFAPVMLSSFLIVLSTMEGKNIMTNKYLVNNFDKAIANR